MQINTPATGGMSADLQQRQDDILRAILGSFG